VYYPLDDANKKFAVRFTARETKMVNKVHIYISSVSSPPTYRIGLQSDSRGFPSGVWLACGDFTPVVGYNAIVLSENVILEESRLYWLVMEYKSGIIDATHYARPTIMEHIPHLLFPNGLEDAQYKFLRSTDGGATWTSLDFEPCWLIEYTDGKGYGQPYHEVFYDAVYGDYFYAMKFQPENRKIVSEVEVNICRVGNPPNDLNIILYNVTDGVEEKSTTIAAADIPTSSTWVKWIFSSPISLQSTKTYRLYMKTVGGDESNCYGWTYTLVYGVDFYIDATWGGRVNCDQRSSDGGQRWSDYPEVDHPFRFTVKFNPALKNAPNSGL
jgi:hypothetical protein